MEISANVSFSMPLPPFWVLKVSQWFPSKQRVVRRSSDESGGRWRLKRALCLHNQLIQNGKKEALNSYHHHIQQQLVSSAFPVWSAARWAHYGQVSPEPAAPSSCLRSVRFLPTQRSSFPLSTATHNSSSRSFFPKLWTSNIITITHFKWQRNCNLESDWSKCRLEQQLWLYCQLQFKPFLWYSNGPQWAGRSDCVGRCCCSWPPKQVCCAGSDQIAIRWYGCRASPSLSSLYENQTKIEPVEKKSTMPCITKTTTTKLTTKKWSSS